MSNKKKLSFNKKIEFRIILLLSIFLLSAFSTFSQNSQSQKNVLLKNGNIIIASKIEYINNYLLIIGSKGERFQINQSEIEQISDILAPTDTKRVKEEDIGHFGALFSIDGGIQNANNTQLGSLTGGDIGIALGVKNLSNGIDFVGIGTGYTLAMHKSTIRNLAYVPIFATGIISLSKHTAVSPFIGSSMGYAFRTKGKYKGGSFIQLKSGVKIAANKQSDLLIGIYAKLANISGIVIEQNEFGQFQGEGNSKLISAGISFSIIF